MPAKPETVMRNIQLIKETLLSVLGSTLSWEELAVTWLSLPAHPSWGRSPAFLDWVVAQDWFPKDVSFGRLLQASHFLDIPIPAEVVPVLSSLPAPFDKGSAPMAGQPLYKWLSNKGRSLTVKTPYIGESKSLSRAASESFNRRRTVLGAQRLDEYACIHGVRILDYRLDLPMTAPRLVRCLRCGVEFETRLFRYRLTPVCPACPQHLASSRLHVTERLVSWLAGSGLQPVSSLCRDIHRPHLPSRRYVLVRHSLASEGHPPCGHLFMAPVDQHNQRSRTKPPVCPRCRALHVFRSHRETLWEAVLVSLRDRGVLEMPGFPVLHLPSPLSGIGDVRVCDRSLLMPQEVDLYLPSLGIGIEFNGFWFHSSATSSPHCKPRTYHRDKSDLALSRGVRLYHFWEDVDNTLILSVLAPHLGIPSTRHHARSLVLSKVSPSEASSFYGLHHAKGCASSSSTHYGLFTQDGLPVSMLSLSLGDAGRAHIERYCNVPFHQVAGGFSRLLTAFLREHPEVSTVLTYCDRDLSPDPSATVYARHGFDLLGSTVPSLRFWCGESLGFGYDKGSVYSRQRCRKSVLLELNPKADPSMSGLALAESMGLYPVYGCGSWSYSLDVPAFLRTKFP